MYEKYQEHDYHAIGEVFKFKETRLVAIEDFKRTCEGCALCGFDETCVYRDNHPECAASFRKDERDVIFKIVTDDTVAKPSDQTGTCPRGETIEEKVKVAPDVDDASARWPKPIPAELYERLDYLGILPNEVREHNVGSSNYAEHTIQPWSIWLDYPELTSWDHDILKRILRTKQGEARELDYEKIIQICQERLRQLKHQQQ